MGAQEWDDHDRHKKQLSRDIARDYLESCAPNAILFTLAIMILILYGMRRKWKAFDLMCAS